jgi:hypothetical protein
MPPSAPGRAHIAGSKEQNMKIEFALMSVLALLSFDAPAVGQTGRTEPEGADAKQQEGEVRDAAKVTPDAETTTTPEVVAWTELLAQRIADENQTIRRSAEQALLSIGKPALATLQKVAADKDAARSEAARRLITRIESAPQRPEPGAGMPGGRGGQAGGRGRFDPVGQALAALELDPDQRAKIEEIRAGHQRKGQELMQQMRSGELDREGFASARTALNQDLLKKLEGTLTPEQLKKVSEAMENAGPRRRDR